jgi:hypothetical protein
MLYDLDMMWLVQTKTIPMITLAVEELILRPTFPIASGVASQTKKNPSAYHIF